MKMKLCFACCEPIGRSRVSRKCRNRKQCKTCKKSHPSCLHGYERKRHDSNRPKNVVSAEINRDTESEVISMCVVPVKLRNKGSGIEVETYAMLDTCSQGTFAKDKVLDQLNAQGTSTSITINTVNGVRS